MKPPVPENEAARLETLRQYEILDTDPEESFNDLTRLAAYICQTPIALITLIDSDRQWFKARVGVSAQETSRDVSFCAHAILQDGAFIVRDALDDERFRTNPMVIAAPHIRFYAGSPLVSPEGFKIGTLCVVDRLPRELSPQQIAALKIISNQVITQLDLRREVLALKRALERQKRAGDAQSQPHH
ncbi:MAG TPA: GAF domain-containing protein [Pyrinomonadaceae bacterium]